jgi:hypothetical protein
LHYGDVGCVGDCAHGADPSEPKKFQGNPSRARGCLMSSRDSWAFGEPYRPVVSKRKRMWSALVAFTAFFTVAMAAVAMADDISNSLDGSIDAIAEVMPLNVGGADVTTTLYVQPRNADGKNGCNLTASTTLVVAVASDNTSVATVSPSSVTFTSCGDTPTLTVTPHNQGSATISVSQTSNNTGGTFNFSPATFTVNVAPPPNTAPTVSITGVTGGASYEIGSVPAATCNVTDAEDGNSSFAATLSAVSGPLSAYGLGEQTASCSYTDGGGLTASASVTYSIVDTTAPVITFASRTTANGNGWNNGDVTVTWSCTDSDSGVVAASVSQTVSTEGANQSATGTCEDHAGNTASDTQTEINIDKTAPTASASAAPASNANGWNKTNVTVSFSGNDGSGSGIDFCDADVVLSSEGAGQSASGTCTDKAGNESDEATASGINIDKTDPDVSLVGGPANGGTYYFGFVPAAPTCSASDALSGLDGSCSVSGYSNALGSHTVTASAADKAGNNASASATYTVLAWKLNGFYTPVDMNGVYNVVKGGSTVPLKFEIFAGSTELTTTSSVKSFVETKVACDGSGPTDEIEVTTTGGTSLRYDATAGQFIQNWQTPKQAGQCYRVTMTTQDDSSLVAFFKLK